MASPTKLFLEFQDDTIILDDQHLYDLGGKIFSLAELRQHVIESETYQKVKAGILE